jgi:CRP/FNR family cyclic AMP-dependent transcriptional regulator
MTSLGAIPALRALPAAVLAATADQARAVRFPAGAVIRPAGQPAPGVVLMLSGTVVAAHPMAAGGEVWSERWVGPRILDKPAVLGGGVPSSGLVAVTAVTARLLPADRFIGLLQEHPSVRAHVLGHLAREVTAARDRLAEAVALPASARIAAWLHAQNTGDGVAWHGSQEHLARLLGLSRVTVNRALARLSRDGAIRRTSRGIVIADRARLESFVVLLR